MSRQTRDSHEFIFTGFQSPNYTTVPDEFFDILAPRLSEAELRVCLYIIRRTFGFKKRVDAIAISQMENGITTMDEDGTPKVLDHGTGLSRRSIFTGIKGLCEKGVIEAIKRRSPKGDAATTMYRLRFHEQVQRGSANNALPQKMKEFHQGGEKFSPPVVQQVNQQHDRSQQTVKQHHHAATAAKGDDASGSGSQSKTPRSIAALHATSGSRVTTVTEPVGKIGTSPNPALVSRLVVAGVSQRQAERLVRSHPSDRIEAALSSLPFRNAKNPAGYLVREIEDGGWLPPVAIQEQEKKTASAAKRKAADEKAAQLEAERARAAEARLRQVEHVVQALAPELVAELWSEARAQVMRFSRLAADDATEQNPFLKAAFSNLVQDRFLGGSE